MPQRVKRQAIKWETVFVAQYNWKKKSRVYEQLLQSVRKDNFSGKLKDINRQFAEEEIRMAKLMRTHKTILSPVGDSGKHELKL